ncbi:hypothetical protein NA56DRAFT_606956 [Hyaloscypha hepaticicola]|uniref:Uncharacterized protein n=1 Tax=Hyaloscypha hepaticicola TaxID=2082293 RepID=A0A2J6PS17_9HELO|nr:hypothetical protein NA56DRAFT_606956 [Hyaloscypha hepaticicola]
MASYHRVLKVFGRSVQDKTLQCDCDIHPWEILVNDKSWSGRIRLIGFVDVFFLISYSGNSRFHDGIVIYKDDHHIEKILKGEVFKDINLLQTSSKSGDKPVPKVEETPEDATPVPKPEEKPKAEIPVQKSEEKPKYATFSRDTFFYIVKSIGHPIGLQTRYKASDLQKYTIQLRKHQDPLLKRKYKNALKQHDTLDMIQDAMKLGLVSYAEILGHGLSHIYRGGSTLDVGKGFVGGVSASKERKWAGLSGDKAG